MGVDGIGGQASGWVNGRGHCWWVGQWVWSLLVGGSGTSWDPVCDVQRVHMTGTFDHYSEFSAIVNLILVCSILTSSSGVTFTAIL